jgi:LuxR family maltose regulon positive regulatory protein
LRTQLELARESRQAGATVAFINDLLAAFGPVASAPPSVHPSLISPLSKREMEVLGLIAAGHSNKEIASECVIAIGTVKRHTVNIFTKLDVKNRTEAVVKGRELGLL